MPFTGVSHKVGEHIDTDAIIPARFLVTTDPKKLGENCMEGLEHGWVKRVQVGDILVAERNFGCGSSREHAPIAILGAGMKAVIAHSFARIFYRNAFNMGLLLLEIGDDVNKIKDGDKTLLICDRVILVNVTWNDLNSAGWIFGKEVTIDGAKYKLRSLTGGTGPRSTFLSTPSARRATCSSACPARCRSHFYPRPPRGGRPSW